MKKKLDFTEGNIFRELILFSVPIVLGEVLQNLYGSVDAMVVGNFVGKNALAAVSVSEPITNLLIGFFTGMSIGASVLVGQELGRADKNGLSVCMRVCFSAAALMGAALSILGIAFAPQLLRLSSVLPEVYVEAALYLRVYLIGLMLTVVYNVGAGILRALGDSRTPFVILGAACGANIALDFLFVCGLHGGVMGVGAATVLAQLLSVVLIYCRLREEDDNFGFAFGELRQRRAVVAKMIGIGIPAGLQNSIISISNLFVWRYINSFSSVAVSAGVGAAQRLDKFVSLPSKSVGLSVTAFVSQNAGARNWKRCRTGTGYGALLAAATAILLGIPVYIFAPQFLRLFNGDEAVLAVGVEMMRTLIPLYSFLAVREALLGALRGYGDTGIPMCLSLLGMVGVRQAFLAVSMRLHPTISNVYYCYPVAWGATALLITAYYFAVRDKKTGELQS